jgi:hypothetical protein
MELAQYAKDVIPSLKQLDKGFALFWFNPDKIRGFRMTNLAFNIMLEREYRHWTFTMKEPLNAGTIIMLDQKMPHPYHINNKRITFFDESMASAMGLSANNIDVAINLIYC